MKPIHAFALSVIAGLLGIGIAYQLGGRQSLPPNAPLASDFVCKTTHEKGKWPRFRRCQNDEVVCYSSGLGVSCVARVDAEAR